MRVKTKIIAVANQKGGVAKTTSTASIGSILAESGQKVLLIDLDPQSSLTESMTSSEFDKTIYDAMRERTAIPTFMLKPNLDLAPSSIDLAAIEIELSAAIQREFVLKDLIDPIKDRYDYIIIDCPPSLGFLTINALTASTDVFIPLIAEALPCRGLQKLLDVVNLIKPRLNTKLKISGVFITLWNNTKLNRSVENIIRGQYKDTVFNTKIRKNVSIAEAPYRFSSINEYAPNSNGAQDYRLLVDEIVLRFSKNRSRK